MNSDHSAKDSDLAPCASKKANGAPIFVIALFALSLSVPSTVLSHNQIDFLDGGSLTYTIPKPPDPIPTIAPTKIENMAETIPGTYESINLDTISNKAAVLHFPISVGYGQTLTVKFTRKSNVPMDGSRNVKVIRLWSPNKYPNTYAGTQTDGSMILYTERLSANRNTRFYFKWPGDNTQGQQETWRFKYPTGLGKADGEINIQVGSQAYNFPNWQADDANNPGLPTLLNIQSVISGTTPLPTGTKVIFSDITIGVD